MASMKAITELLPHRSPFLHIDELESADGEQIVGYRTFGSDEPFFAGHFPGHPVVPGVLLVEAMAQCGGAGVNQTGVLGEALFFLASIEKAKFRRQVMPDERIRFEIENVRVSGRMLRQRGRAYVGDELAAEAQWMCLVDRRGGE